MKSLLRAAVWIVALLVAGAVAVAAFVAFGIAGFFGLSNPFTSETVDRSQPALLKSIEDISEYHAAVGNFEVVLDVENDVKYIPSFIAGDRSLFVAAGTVDAYVDFSGLADGDLTVSEDGTSVEIRLPEAELGEPNLDQEKTYLYDQSRGLVDRVSDAFSTADQGEIYQLAEDKLAAAAAESQLLEQATTNTRTMLGGLFGSLDMTVTFADQP